MRVRTSSSVGNPCMTCMPCSLDLVVSSICSKSDRMKPSIDSNCRLSRSHLTCVFWPNVFLVLSS
jgi:hypothetical protein